MDRSESNKQTPVFERRRSFRDIRGVITKMNPEVVKTVIANVCVPSTPKDAQKTLSALPLCDPVLNGYEENAETGTMTIFYNGMVSVFCLSPDKAQDILNFVEGRGNGISKSVESSSYYNSQNLLETLNGDLPLARKKSLQRFLEKRKERLTMVSPYEWATTTTNSTPKY